ncbi:hypothetical protein [Bosea sp. Root381]|jgi:hypothetical protein|uniref:hypothetical protein n=1 Tax=Bosea sp. Root381 TaxID=1736524 RepID=UPI0006F6D6EE|nr:hypothetical protein [Bosea sp. Root381]
MTYVLNDASLLPAAVSTKAAGEGFWQRLYAAMIESRRRSALRELRAYSYLINESETVLGGLPGTTVSTDASLPFNR